MKKHPAQPSFSLSILGGGMAGLAVAYFARQRGLPFTLYEKQNKLGGNCITHKWGDYLFDSGAHRVHDRNREATREVKALMADSLKTVEIPSKIYDDGAYLTFPLNPYELFQHLGLRRFFAGGLAFMKSKLKRPGNGKLSFEDMAVQNYGRLVAERYLLNYSEKLWGLPGKKLSRNIAGSRLSGLDLRAFLMEALPGNFAWSHHSMEGRFYYPEGGIGAIANRLAEVCGEENIRRGSAITGIARQGPRLRSIMTSRGDEFPVDQVISTLPMNRFLKALTPAPPAHILALADKLIFRNVRLIFFSLSKPSAMKAATVYFPDRRFSFTRLYEPRNRWPAMSPPERTSIVAEVPYQPGDHFDGLEEAALIAKIQGEILTTGLVAEGEILGVTTRDLPEAYPVLEIGYEKRLQAIMGYLGGFENLELCGRNARFEYTWIHNLICDAKALTAKFTGDGPEEQGP